MASPDPTSSIDAFVKSAQEQLQRLAQGTTPPVNAALPAVSFWLERRNVLAAIEELVQIKDVSQIRPNSRITIQLEFAIEGIVYRLVIRTVVSQNGVFQLRYSEIVDMDFPYSEKDSWDSVKEYAKENALGLAGLMLSLLNASLNIMRLKPF